MLKSMLTLNVKTLVQITENKIYLVIGLFRKEITLEEFSGLLAGNRSEKEKPLTKPKKRGKKKNKRLHHLPQVAAWQRKSRRRHKLGECVWCRKPAVKGYKLCKEHLRGAQEKGRQNIGHAQKAKQARKNV